MVPFDLWAQGLVLIAWNLLIVGIPCFLITKIGLKLIHQLGHYPSNAPGIHMGIFVKLMLVEVTTFIVLAASYQVLSWK